MSSNERLLPHDSSKDFRTVFVSNLSFEVDEEELKTFFSKVRPNKKKTVFRVTQPILNLLVKPRIFFMFSGKNITLCILKCKMPFKMHKNVFFFVKKIQKNY